LNVGETIEPVEKALNGLTKRTDKSGESVAGGQEIILSFLSWSEQYNGMLFL